MKGQSTWSYAPYRPLLCDVGEICICRVAPSENAIHLEWLPTGEKEYQIHYCKSGEEKFTLCGITSATEFDIADLESQCDYRFYVCAGEKKSLTRLARTGSAVGTVVNYLHPEDNAYAFSGHYLCSPSLLRHPDGYLLASMDVYAAKHPQNLTLIFRSDDDGASWHYLSELMPCFWGKLFLHKGEVYMLSVSTEYGDLLIGKSPDGGKSFSAPVCLLRGSNGKNGKEGVHKNPQNLLSHKGRLYTTLEWGSWDNKEYCHAAMVMSCDENADLLIPENWHFTPPKSFDPADAHELSHLPKCTMTIEGTLALSPEGELYNVMRFGGDRCAIAYRVNTEDPDAPLTYSHCIPFPANLSKFMIRYDEVSHRYYSIACLLPPKESRKITGVRNHLVLMGSEDLLHWRCLCDLIDRSCEDPKKIGFQYVDFFFEGEDILYLCRTAINGAANYHDANYSTFHRLKHFRRL